MSTAPYHHPSAREMLSGVMHRLDRVRAAGDTLRSLADQTHTDPSTLADALESLQHDLLLAAREADSARERIIR